MAKLHFYYSTMNAGKSTTLLQSDYNYRERGMNTMLFTPAVDNRYGVGKITSRLGVQTDAIIFDSITSLDKLVMESVKTQPIHCVLIDEAQFLTKQQVAQLGNIVDALNIPVLAYGIRSDFQAELFEGSQYLLAWADQLIEIKTICHCGNKATHILRLNGQGQVVRSGQQLEIGGNNQYVSVCRKHFKMGTV